MKIKKYYEEVINLGNYQTARIGLSLETEKEKPTVAEIKEISNQLFLLSKTIVEGEIKILKIEREQTKENG